MQLVIDPNGQIRCLYDEAVDLTSLGDPRIVRASHVEPTNDARWTANLDPVGGPTLGPFEHRSQALTAELEWLNRNWLIRSGVDPERRKANFHPFGSRRYGDQTARVEALFVFLHFPPGAIE